MNFRILIISSLWLLSCGKYSGFEDYNNYLHIRLDKFGDDNQKIDSASYILVEFIFCSSTNCEEKSNRLSQIISPSLYTSEPFWNERMIEDELTILLDSCDDKYWLDLLKLNGKEFTWPVIAQVKTMASARTNHYVGNEKYKDTLLHYRELKELERLKSQGDFEDKSGTFIQVDEIGEGDTIGEGSEVVLSYKAYFSDGQLFDDTDKWDDTLIIKYGVPFQIILGLELGIEGLTEGSQAKIIIPSQLAFGKDGSSSGIVPPYEPLIYELKILSVKSLET